jgi:nucleoside-diphosphate-sugar epimerase
MRIFLTGQDGFIGGEILRQARAAGHEVMGLQKPFRMANPPWEKIEAFAPEVCIHCAWIATPGVYLESSENVQHREWSLAMIHKLAAMETRRFVVAGTCAEYGPSVYPLHEVEEPSPSTLYGQEKNLLRIQLEEELRHSGLDLIWTRIFYPYGPGEHPDRLISFLISKALNGEESPLKQPRAVRDYIHVQDLSGAFLLLAEKGDPGIYNIGSGQGVRLSELRDLVFGTFGKASKIAENKHDNAVIDSVVADISKISELGWRPRFDIKDGLSTYSPPFKTNQP